MRLLAHCLKITQNVSFEIFDHFFLLKLTRQSGPFWSFLINFKKSTQDVNLARFVHNVEQWV